MNMTKFESLSQTKCDRSLGMTAYRRKPLSLDEAVIRSYDGDRSCGCR
jgi:hypothetical protein